MPAARLTDMHTCPAVNGVVPHVGGPVVGPGMPNVLIGSLPAARVTDLLVCVGPPDVIAKGSATVMIGGLPAARLGDLTAHGGVLVLGLPTVLIGDAPGVGAGGSAGPPPFAGANGPFATQDEAARAALQAANPRSVIDNLEFGGVIYRDASGNYFFSGPAQGTDQGFNPTSAPAPPGTTVVGDYHTHGDYSTLDPATGAAVRTSDPARDDFASDQFSPPDLNGIANDGAGTPGYRGYLGTPSGQFRSYDPATGTTSLL